MKPNAIQSFCLSLSRSSCLFFLSFLLIYPKEDQIMIAKIYSTICQTRKTSNLSIDPSFWFPWKLTRTSKRRCCCCSTHLTNYLECSLTELFIWEKQLKKKEKRRKNTQRGDHHMFTNKKGDEERKKTESTEKEKEMRLIWLETTRGANRMKKRGIRLFVCVCVCYSSRSRTGSINKSTQKKEKKRVIEYVRVCIPRLNLNI